MTRLMSCKNFLAAAAVAVMFAFLCLPAVFCQDKGAGEASYHNQRGVEYFKKGFYDHAPKSQVAESDRNYGLAVEEFKSAITRDPSYADAHRNLARVYYVQKNFDGAALEYKRVTELAPRDLDAYVNLALALVELKRLDEAIQALENASQQTSDAKALDTLDRYISKVRAHQAKEVR